MSRLPMLSTPGRGTGSPTGIPTPTAQRRPRSSLATSHQLVPDDHDEMDAALHEVLAKRTSVSSVASTDAAHAPPSAFLQPRTPGVRAKTPAGLGLGASHNNPVTPSNPRPSSRLSLAGRASIGAANTPAITPRRTSMASSTTSTTPYGRRPESRASISGVGERWAPLIGDRVRVGSLGMEGTLRYLGTVDFRDGVWAGIELEGGFAGKGKNDGTVEGRQYFSCPANCGMFVAASKLSAPTSGPSRPVSVASSYRSLASNSVSGRQTPGFDSRARPSTTTPARATRTVSSSTRSSSRIGPDHDDAPAAAPATVRRTMLGNSTSSNAALAAEGKITAGSRASKYLGMTAKQLDSQRAVGTKGAGMLNASTTSTVAGTTPRAPRMSMGGVTPARARPSLGGVSAANVTPKARGPRMSSAMEMMPPPPSPGRVKALSVQALEEEVRELKRRNAELEDEAALRGDDEGIDPARLEEMKNEVERVREEADALRYQLSASQADAADATRLAEELQVAEEKWKSEAEARERVVEDLKREMRIASERANDELEAGMEEKRRQVAEVTRRAEEAEQEAEASRQQVELLESSGLAIIEVQEQKQAELEAKVAELKSLLYKARDDLEEAREAAKTASAANGSASDSLANGDAAPRDPTAVEIDNETLRAQLKHLQSKISHLEEDLDETRASADTDIESWRARHTKAKEAERVALDEVRKLKAEQGRLHEQAGAARVRFEEIQVALKENQLALESARAEIEVLREGASEAAGKESQVKDRMVKEAEERRVDAERRMEEVERELTGLRDVQVRALELESKVESLEAEIVTLKHALKVDTESPPKPDSSDPVTITAPSPPSSARRARTSTGSIEDAEKSIRGYRHIVQEMSGENGVLKGRVRELEEEVASLKEEVKLLQEINEAEVGANGGTGEGSKELAEAKKTISTHAATIKELEREVSELESLVEAKIYREDELEQRTADLTRDRDRWRDKATAVGVTPPSSALPPVSASASSFSHRSTSGSAPTSASASASETVGGREGSAEGTRCELCEGPHDLDKCPVLSGETLVDEEEGEQADRPSPLAGKAKKKWCADCENTEHNTDECPLAEDVF